MGERQARANLGAVSWRRGKHDFAPVQLDQALDNGEAEAGAAKKHMAKADLHTPGAVC